MAVVGSHCVQGISVPSKSPTKSLIQPIKIKNLLHLIPDISKFNRETQFVISKATEMFISFYASKAAGISKRRRKHEAATTTTISNNDCFYALQSDERLHFLRAVAIRTPLSSSSSSPLLTTRKRGTKRKNRSPSDHDSDGSCFERTSESIPSPSSLSGNSLDMTPQQKRRRLCWGEQRIGSPSQSTATSNSTFASPSTPTQIDAVAPLSHIPYHSGYLHRDYFPQPDGYQSVPAVAAAPHPAALPLPPLPMCGVHLPRIDGLPPMMKPFDHNMYYQQRECRSHSSPKSQIVSVDEIFQAEDWKQWLLQFWTNMQTRPNRIPDIIDVFGCFLYDFWWRAVLCCTALVS